MLAFAGRKAIIPCKFLEEEKNLVEKWQFWAIFTFFPDSQKKLSNQHLSNCCHTSTDHGNSLWILSSRSNCLFLCRLKIKRAKIKRNYMFCGRNGRTMPFLCITYFFVWNRLILVWNAWAREQSVPYNRNESNWTGLMKRVFANKSTSNRKLENNWNYLNRSCHRFKSSNQKTYSQIFNLKTRIFLNAVEMILFLDYIKPQS